MFVDISIVTIIKFIINMKTIIDNSITSNIFLLDYEYLITKW